MANLIITVISIALVAVAALAGAFYGGGAFLDGRANVYANRIIGDIQQIDSAFTMMAVQGTAPTATACCTNIISTITAQMNNTPQAPTNILAAPNNAQNYEGWFISGTPNRLVVALKIGGSGGTAENLDTNGQTWGSQKHIGRKICDQVLKISTQFNVLQGVNNTSFGTQSYIDIWTHPHGLSCWWNASNNRHYISMSRAY